MAPRPWTLLRLAGRSLSSPLLSFEDVTEEAAVGDAKLVIFGEVHGDVVAAQVAVARAMARTLPPRATLHVVCEHFSQADQPLLDEYASGELDLAGLHAAYDEGSTEGHDLAPYAEVLEFACSHPRVRLHGGFMPRPLARTAMKDGLELALEQAKAKGYVAAAERCRGNDKHYAFFESLLAQRDPHGSFEGRRRPSQRWRPMFGAQVLKDASMAHAVSKLLAPPDADGRRLGFGGGRLPPADRVLVLLGNGHMGFGCGVPERISAMPGGNVSTVTMYSRSLPLELTPPREVPGRGFRDSLPEDDMSEVLRGVVGATAASPAAADFCVVYRDEVSLAAARAEAEAAAAVKAETAAAYDDVGATADLPGNLHKAVQVMRSLGYSDAEIAFAGQDAYNYQGVGHPHRHAAIQCGEICLDLGSGLGVDSLIASSRVGDWAGGGRVVGIDISEKEVKHANVAARRRNANAVFFKADLEKLPLPDESVDVIISNGAFCLVPDKKQGFAEAYRVLKPGGRMAVCTTTVKDALPEGVEWPICMCVFAKLPELEGIVRSVGFEDVALDLSDSGMTTELTVDEYEERRQEQAAAAATASAAAAANAADGPGGADVTGVRSRNKVHGEGAERDEAFKYLDDYDMDSLCARVVVIARKPMPEEPQGEPQEASYKIARSHPAVPKTAC